MEFLLDTNVLIAILRNRSKSVVDEINQRPTSSLATCTVVEAELIFGLEKSRAGQEQRDEVSRILTTMTNLSFDSLAAAEYGIIRAFLERRGMAIGNNDTMSASIALANNLTVVTHNVSEFSRVPGLRVEDWEV